MLWFLPLIFLWIFISRRASATGQSIMGIGKSGSRYRVDKDTGVNFADVAGCDEAKAAIGDDLLDGTGGHSDLQHSPNATGRRTVRSKRGSTTRSTATHCSGR